ncbi:MAG: methyl-accepting chemotaxis protein [Veillonellales bacterium]
MKFFSGHKEGKLTLRKKLAFFFVLIAAIPLFFTTIVTLYVGRAALLESVYSDSGRTAAGLASDIDAMLVSNIQLLQAMADSGEIISMDVEKQRSFLNEIAQRTPGISTFIVSDANGVQTVRTKGENTENSERDYFIKLRQGDDFSMSDVQIGHSTGKASLVLAVPIRDSQKNFVGALLGVVDFDKLSQKVLDTRYGASGYAFLVDQKGKIIVHPDGDLMKNMKDVNDLLPVQSALSGKSGSVSYDTQDGKQLAGFSRLPFSGWGVVVQQPESEAVAGTNKIIFVGIGFTLAAILLAALAGIIVASFITKPIGKLLEATNKFSRGDLNASVDIKSGDEIEHLADAFNIMAKHLKNLIQSVKENASRVSSAARDLASSAGEVKQATNQVAVTMNQFAQGAQKQLHELDDNLQEANQMMETSNIVAERTVSVSDLSKDMSQDAKTGDAAVVNAVEKINEIKDTTKLTVGSVKTLEEKSWQIGEILDVISGIAGQTNLLALNAAIEAARAGVHGRGFAVVAEEVRNLAEQSQTATDEIASIIGKIKQHMNDAVSAMDTGNVKVNEGVVVVNQVKQVLLNIMEQIDKNEVLIREMALASKQQMEVTQRMAAGIRQVADIARSSSDSVQTTAAATEEITASMEGITDSANVLAKTAAELQAVISKFQG